MDEPREGDPATGWDGWEERPDVSVVLLDAPGGSLTILGLELEEDGPEMIARLRVFAQREDGRTRAWDVSVNFKLTDEGRYPYLRAELGEIIDLTAARREER